MAVSVDTLIGKLPPYKDEWILVNKKQAVNDIVREVLAAHEEFKDHYNKIALYFDASSTEKICDRLYDFCKKNIKYKEESEEDQTTALPTGILVRGYGDCKHYSGFTGGVLDALNRNGKKITWCYRFASYKLLSSTPHHVFIVVNDNGNELWIDPTPGALTMEPVWIVDKKIKCMALHRNIAGINDSETEIEIQPDFDFSSDENLTPDFIAAIEMLLYYGVLDLQGNIDDTRLIDLSNSLTAQEYTKLTEAWQKVQGASVTGLFQDIWRGVKKVSLAVPRNAYLSLVALNIFGTATKLKQAISTAEGEQKISDKWYSLGGTYDKLKNAINSGAKKKRIGSIGNPVVLPAWVAVASAIIAALTPIINSIINKQKQYGMVPVEGWDPALMDPTYGGLPQTQNNVMDFIKQNPILVAGAGVIIYLLVTKKKII